ncbi:hypothetical protein SEA_KRADAL_31 [Streptomyces phage Kradal]|nr:hypothetical protein SEA_KRADAL_31 [Streptomyces phage Kradal]QPL14348.1 hypothetical protein SEA_EHYELIMAYOE_31 [Streptomyces phage EhyElimayoE]
MADVRDPERDQPLPRPGKIPVQEVMIRAIEERREYGKKKYGRVLETDNGRDALKDAWEEALDLFTYLTQARLERGDRIEGMERMAGSPEPAALDEVRGGGTRGLADLIPENCPLCRHEPHTPGHCRSRALNLGCPCGT